MALRCKSIKAQTSDRPEVRVRFLTSGKIRNRSACFTLAAVLSLAVALGCAPAEKIGTVKGNVTYRGKPVTSGSVIFENPQTGAAVMASLQADGSYVALTFNQPGLVVGRYKVAISPSQIGSGEIPLAVNPADIPAAAPPAVPEKYHTSATSGLAVDVKEGENSPFNFDLVD